MAIRPPLSLHSLQSVLQTIMNVCSPPLNVGSLIPLDLLSSSPSHLVIIITTHATGLPPPLTPLHPTHSLALSQRYTRSSLNLFYPFLPFRVPLRCSTQVHSLLFTHYQHPLFLLPFHPHVHSDPHTFKHSFLPSPSSSSLYPTHTRTHSIRPLVLPHYQYHTHLFRVPASFPRTHALTPSSFPPLIDFPDSLIGIPSSETLKAEDATNYPLMPHLVSG